MLLKRRARDRGHADHGWLDTRHTFSFARYYDPEFMGFQSLRVLNEDIVRPGAGFGAHPHRDMEILTYVLSGTLRHEDSMGHAGDIRPGEIQRMSAGTGVTHSERNPSSEEPVHFLQVWIVPEEANLPPTYEQKRFFPESAAWRTESRLVAARDGRDGALGIHQDADLRIVRIRGGDHVAQSIAEGRHAWVQVARGRVRVGDLELEAGDGLAASGEPELELAASEDSELLVFDLAPLAVTASG